MYQRVCFFQPRTQAKANYSNAAGREQTWAPWFAFFLATAARTAGLEPELIDARVDDGWRTRVARLGPTDVLAVSVMTGAAITDALEASSIAKSHGAYVVWGGPHVTLFPAQTLTQSPADAVIPGVGFAGLLVLLQRLTGQAVPVAPHDPMVLTKGGDSPRADVSSLLRRRPDRSGDGLIIAPDTTPDLDLISDWEPYVNPDVAIASRTVNYVTSEGCLRKCTFCSEPQTSGHSWYVREVERSVTMIADMTARAGASGLKLHDPNFFHDDPRSDLFARLFAEQVGLPWAASLHPADLQAMSDERLQLMAEAGLCRVLMGLETPVPALVKLGGKRYDPAGIPLMAQRLAGAGVRGMFTFIVGWPDAEPGHYQQTIDAAFAIRERWDQHQCKIHFLEPWPGTPLSTLMTRRGLTFPTTLEGWARIDYYTAQYAELHDPAYTDVIRQANAELSPYVDA
jgi:anaerobic magnesium-protoporphyrin IX monomethyl ester cyclase